tara:strand:+ start:155 stop:325 length:171 start_codon:yes stop_codon:yes gene_type:complete
MKRQNPVARLLSDPKFKPRAVFEKTKYNRKKVDEKINYNGMMGEGLSRMHNTKRNK